MLVHSQRDVYRNGKIVVDTVRHYYSFRAAQALAEIYSFGFSPAMLFGISDLLLPVLKSHG